jgi:tRNA threonylcarbamoyladenosine biosynthesis protein TsaE
MAAEMFDGEKPEGQDAAFKCCRKDGADGACDDTDEDVGGAHKHIDSFGEWQRVASDVFNFLDRDQLRAVAARLARTLRPGDALALSGELGAGKTTFVRALVQALHGSDVPVSSPTFIFRQQYDGTPPVEHLDLYRVDAPADAAELGLDEAFGSDRITVVEWPERLPGLLPARAIRIRIDGAGDEPRRLQIER